MLRLLGRESPAMGLDTNLKDFLAGREAGRQSVIVEVARPKVSPPDRYMAGAGGRGGTRASKPGSLSETLQRVEKAIAGLGLASPPIRMETTGTLVVEVTSDQLRQILELPGVAAVHPNRKRRAPRPKSTGAL